MYLQVFLRSQSSSKHQAFSTMSDASAFAASSHLVTTPNVRMPSGSYLRANFTTCRLQHSPINKNLLMTLQQFTYYARHS